MCFTRKNGVVTTDLQNIKFSITKKGGNGGFYLGAITVSLLFVLAIVFFARFEKSRKQHQFIYAEIADMCRLNETIDQIENAFSKDIVYKVVPSRSNTPNHLGLEIDFKDSKEDNIKLLMGFDNVIFAIKDNDEI